MRKVTVLLLMLMLLSISGFNQLHATTCADAQVVPTLPSMPWVSNLVCGTANDITGTNATPCGSASYLGGLEAVYVWTPAGNYDEVTFAYSGQTWTGLFLYEGCPTDGGLCIANVTSSTAAKTLAFVGTNQTSGTKISLTQGVTYYLVIDTYPSPPSPCPGTITINGILQLVGAPEDPSNPSPANMAINVPYDGQLTWTFGDNTDTYDLMLGTAGNMVKVVDNAVAGATGSYSYSGLGDFTKYYWQVIAKNDLATLNGPVWSFTTLFTGGFIATYTDGDIETDYGSPWVGPSTCPGIMTVTIPEGKWVTRLDVSYSMTAANGAYMSEQRSKIYSPTLGAGESQYFAGVGIGGTFNYSRQDLPFAIGALGEIVFHMDAGRTWGSTPPDDGCGIFYNKVDNGTWKLVLYLDDIPDCVNPTNFAGDNVTATSIDLSWTAGYNTSLWNVKYGAPGFDPEVEGMLISGIVAPAHTLTDLEPATPYDVYVQADCTEESFSEWVGPVSFTTQSLFDLAVVAILSPVDQCFDGTALVTISITNFGLETVNVPFEASYAIDGGTPVVEPVNVPVAQNEVVEFTFSAPIEVVLTEDYSFELTTEVSLAGDANPANDMLSAEVTFYVIPDAPVGVDATITSGSTATLQAISDKNIFWYATPVDDMPLAAGEFFTTPVLFNTTSYYAAAVVGETFVDGSLQTSFAGGNGCGAGNMFDLQALAGDLPISGFTINPNAANSAAPVTIWTKSGTYIGFETNQAAWTQLGTYTVNAVALVPVYVDIDDFVVPNGEVVGVYVQYNAAYTDVTALTTYENDDLKLTGGAGFCTAFAPIANRMFNGIVHYQSITAICESDRTEVTAFIPQGAVEGTVMEASRGAIENARVFSGDYEAFTDENGYFIIDNVSAGLYDFTAEADDYFSQTIEDVEIIGGETTDLDFQLGYAQIAVNPDSFDETLLPEDLVTKTMTISNPGGTEPLTWSAGVEFLDEGKSRYNVMTQQQIPQGSSYDINPEPSHFKPEPTDAQFDLLGSFPVNDVGGTYAVATDGNFIYTGRWNSNQYDKYTMDGTYIESFSIPGAGSTRDLTYDGQYFYGAPNNANIYQMDFNTQTLVSTIVATGSTVRGIAYDSDNDAFWVTGASFTGPLRLISRAGTVLQTVTPAFGGISGLAYDNVSPDGPYIWANTPGASTGEHILVQVNIATGATAQTFNATGLGIFAAGTVSGGTNITDLVVPGKWTFLSVSQNDVVWILELANSTPPWLTIEPKNGVVAPGESIDVDVVFNSAGLPDTTYYANININHDGQLVGKGTVTVPVEMTVASTVPPVVATLVSPANNATLVPLQPVFTWINGAGTSFNRLVITTGNPPFQTTVFQSPWFLGESFDLSTTAVVLDLKKTYDWQVRSRNAAGTVSTTSRKFTTIGAGTIQGTVTDAYSGQPLQGVTITAEELRYSTETGADGTYLLPGVLEGNYEVTASFPFYVDQTQQTTVQHNGNSIVNFELNEELPPPFGLQAQVQNVFDVLLTWVEPGGGFPPAWVTYSDGTYATSIGTDAAANYDYAIKFTPDQLSQFPGGSVSKVSFIPGEDNAFCQYTIKIWQGATPTLIYSQTLPSIVNLTWNEITLASAVPFDDTQDLWIGINVNTTQGFPSGASPGPAVAGFGDLLNLGAGWISMFNEYGLNYNWALSGYVEYLGGGKELKPIIEEPIAYVNRGLISESPEKVNVPSVSFDSPSSTRATFVEYNIYRDGVLIGSTEETLFNDFGLIPGVYSYEVTADYLQGESDPAGPKVVSILAPPTLITAVQDGDAINLEWVSNFVGKGDNATAEEAISVSNVADRMAATSKEERLHGPTTRVPQATESRAVGDDCVDPIVVGALPYINVNTTCGRGNTYDLTCLGSYDGGEDIIYKLVLTETKVLEVAMSTTTTYTGMLISNECPPVNCIAFGTNFSAGGVTLIQELAAGTYYIMMDTWPTPDCIPDFTLTIEEIIPEPGQTCGTAVTAIEGLNTAPSAPYWYQFTPLTDGLLTISSCLEGQLVDTDLVVWDACGGAIVAANDDLLAACGFYQYASAVSFPAEAGVSYKIQWLDTWTANGFSFTIDLGDLCVVECPTGAIIETEFCGEDTNGGCNGVPNAFDPIEIGDVICGTSYADAGSRDTDWYQLVIDSPKMLTWTVTAEFPVYAFIIDGNSGCATSAIIGTIGQAAPCVPAVASALVAPGTYWLWVGPQFFEGYPCGSQNNYVAELTAEDAFLPFFTLYRNGDAYADVFGTDYVDAGIEPGMSYCYTVTETPEEGITTAHSNELCAEIPFYGELAVNPDELLEVHTAAPELTTQTIMVTNNGDGVMEFDISVQLLDRNASRNEYCVGGPTSTADSEIRQLDIEGDNGSAINFLGCPGLLGLNDQTGLVADLTPGETYSLFIKYASCSATLYGGSGSVWIDFNGDMTFTPDELIGSSNWPFTAGAGEIGFDAVYTFTVPENAVAGFTRMRAVQWEGGVLPLNPCGTFSWGSMIDFGVQISDVSWLTVEPKTGTLNPGESMPVEVTFNSAELEYGTYNANLLFTTNDPFTAQPEVVVPVELIVALPSQDILLPMGWSGWSSYIDPMMDAAFADVIAPVVDDMIITQYFSNLFYPAYGINTMGDFTNNHGYVTKMDVEAILTLEGMTVTPTVSLNAGWNLFPVLASCNLSAAEVFGGVTGLIIAYEVAGNGIYYPAMGINTLVTLVPGKAYWVKVTGATEYTFPACAKDASSSWVAPLRHANTTPWNEVSYTGISHVVAFDATASSGFVAGDVIGAFTANGTCAGITIYDGKAASLALFGNDITTAADDGFAEGEQLNFKVYRAANETEYILDVTYSTQAPNYDGTFAASGVSVINDITMTATGIGSPELNGLSIYPNPSQGMFNVAIDNLPKNISYTVSDAKGQAITSGKLAESQVIDLTSQPKGVYFIRFTGDNVLRIEKLVIR